MITRRAAVYARVSTEGQRLNGSLGAQVKSCLARAAEKNYSVAPDHIFQEVFLADQVEGRPVLETIRGLAKKGAYEVLLVDLVDRFSRANPAETVYFIGLMNRYGVEVEILQVPDDPMFAPVILMIYNQAAMIEAAAIRRRTQAGRMRRVKGESAKNNFEPRIFIAPAPLFGYAWDNPAKGKRAYYVVDPSTARVVVLIYERVAAGVPLGTVARDLNAQGVPTPAQVNAQHGRHTGHFGVGRGWTRTQVARIINNPAYSGDYAAYRWKRESTMVRDPQTGMLNKHVVIRERKTAEEGLVPLGEALVPALVDRALAAAARSRLARNKAESPRRIKPENEAALLLRGFVVCAACGRRMVSQGTRPEGRKTPRYYCHTHAHFREGLIRQECVPNSVQAPALNSAVWQEVVRLLTDPTTLAGLLDKVRDDQTSQRETAQDRLAVLHTSIRAAEEEIERLCRDLRGNTSERNRARIHQDIGDLDGQIDVWKRAIEEVEQGEALTEQRQQQFQTILQAARHWDTGLATMIPEQQRGILYGLRTRVLVAPPDVMPRITLELPAFGLVQTLSDTNGL